jgi:glucose-6-phosphate 1-dehydrogenase
MTKEQGLDKGMQLRSGPLQLNFSDTWRSARIPMPTSGCCWK